MPAMAECTLPFPRGKTAGDGQLSLDDTTLSALEGKEYVVDDSVHNTGTPVRLRIVKNDTGGALTVARKFGKFSAGSAYDFGRRIGTFPNTTAGGVVVPVDDAYAVGQVIPQYDLFYVVVEGWCSVLTGASVSSLAAGIGVTSDNAGLIANKANPAAAEFVVGTLTKQASYATTTATAIYVDLDLHKPPAAG